MRKILSLTFLLLPFFIFSQVSIGTNHDEYKYLNKGYAYQKEMGLDGTKQNYSLEDIFLASNGVNFKALYNRESSLVGMIVEINLGSKNPIFIGLPTNDSSEEIHQMAEADQREKLNLNAKEKFDKAMQEFAMAQVGGGIKKNQMSISSRQNLKTTTTPNEPIPTEYETISPLRVDKSIENSERPKGATVEEKGINNNVITNHTFKERNLLKPIVVKGEHPVNGTVVIKMCIDIDGKIKSAKFTQRGSTTMHPELRKMALSAAKKAEFSKGLDPEQCGVISFKFQ